MDVPWLRTIEADLTGNDRIVEVAALAGGEVNETLRVRCESGLTLVVRRAPEEVPAWHPTIAGQVAAIECARAAGVPVPHVTYASDRVLAYEYIEGEALRPAGVSSVVAREAGRVHGRLHAVQGAGMGPVQADGMSPGWDPGAAFAAVNGWIENLLHAETALNASDLETVGELLGGFVVPPSSSLLHGDASPGNTIATEGRIVSLIDFDDAWYGDPAGDAAWWWWNSPETGDDFVAGCAETSAQLDMRTVWAYRLRLLLGLADTFAAKDPARARRISTLLGVAVPLARSVWPK